MFSLWFFILKASASAILGQSTNAWFKKTKVGVWFYAKVDLIIDFLVKRWGLTFLEQPEDSWKYKYPMIRRKISEIEKRISKLENNTK